MEGLGHSKERVRDWCKMRPDSVVIDGVVYRAQLLADGRIEVAATFPGGSVSYSIYGDRETFASVWPALEPAPAPVEMREEVDICFVAYGKLETLQDKGFMKDQFQLHTTHCSKSTAPGKRPRRLPPAEHPAATGN